MDSFILRVVVQASWPFRVLVLVSQYLWKVVLLFAHFQNTTFGCSGFPQFWRANYKYGWTMAFHDVWVRNFASFRQVEELYYSLEQYRGWSGLLWTGDRKIYARVVGQYGEIETSFGEFGENRCSDCSGTSCFPLHPLLCALLVDLSSAFRIHNSYMHIHLIIIFPDKMKLITT